jgi:hypothetical protein
MIISQTMSPNRKKQDNLIVEPTRESPRLPVLRQPADVRFIAWKVLKPEDVSENEENPKFEGVMVWNLKGEDLDIYKEILNRKGLTHPLPRFPGLTLKVGMTVNDHTDEEAEAILGGPMGFGVAHMVYTHKAYFSRTITEINLFSDDNGELPCYFFKMSPQPFIAKTRSPTSGDLDGLEMTVMAACSNGTQC